RAIRSPHAPRGTRMRGRMPLLASAAVAVIAVAMICGGAAALANAGGQRAATQDLLTSGRPSVVTDARVKIFTGSDGERRVIELEVAFDDAGRTVVLPTRTVPNLKVDISGPDGWEQDFTGKTEIIGAPVRYLPGTNPTVELESELANQRSSSWGFFDILSVAMCAMGTLMLVGASMSALRRR
ncbi:MAG: hypothetical protein L0G99_07555, partial [Propionibacteriales bacterium]|nr:hypothetical protein [Propionibacteriales bacterium]